ncbi:MAG: hypothetical protein VCD00_18965 [Candidatus Hydrogenedentota bacterium]
MRTNPFLEPLRDDLRYWAFIDTLDFSPLPPEHPGYGVEQAWKIQHAAEKVIIERGLVPREGN